MRFDDDLILFIILLIDVRPRVLVDLADERSELPPDIDFPSSLELSGPGLGVVLFDLKGDVVQNGLRRSAAILPSTRTVTVVENSQKRFNSTPRAYLSSLSTKDGTPAPENIRSLVVLKRQKIF